jgi:hypothetical protein
MFSVVFRFNPEEMFRNLDKFFPGCYLVKLIFITCLQRKIFLVNDISNLLFLQVKGAQKMHSIKIKRRNEMKKQARKSRKPVAPQVSVEAPAVNVPADNSYYHQALSHSELFNNVQTPTVLTIDNLKLQKVDVMKSSLGDVIRKLVRQLQPYHVIRLHVHRFYANTNDRSKTRRPDKEADLNKYADARTKKYLRDILKEQFAVTLFKEVLSPKQYAAKVK